MLQPFVLSLAIQERRTKGKYTGFHWRKEFKKYLSTKEGENWYKNELKGQDNRRYIKQLLKEIKC